jgi:hypothetical protein
MKACYSLTQLTNVPDDPEFLNILFVFFSVPLYDLFESRIFYFFLIIYIHISLIIH